MEMSQEQGPVSGQTKGVATLLGDPKKAILKLSIDDKTLRFHAPNIQTHQKCSLGLAQGLCRTPWKDDHLPDHALKG